MILGIGLRLGIGGYRGGDPPAPQPITGTTPLISDMIDGQQIAEVVAWGSHESTAGITSDTKQMRISGGSWVAYVGTTEPAEDATVQVRQLVDDDAGSPQVIFTSNIVTVAAAPAVDAAVISGTFTEVGDTYNITTDSPSDGNYIWARTAQGVTLTANGSGGWTGGTVASSGSQAVGADSSAVSFDAGGTGGEDYKIHVYQRNAASADSNVIASDYTKDAAGGDTTFRAFAFDGNALGHGLQRVIPGKSTSSIQMWIKRDADSPAGSHTFFASETGAEQVWYDVVANRIYARSGNGAAIYRTGATASAWYHVYVEFGPSGVSLQFNGGAAATNGTAPTELTTSGVILVGQDDGPDNTFPGLIADVLYRTATGIETYSGGSRVAYSGGYAAGDFHLLGHDSSGKDASGNGLDFAESSAGTVVYSDADLP